MQTDDLLNYLNNKQFQKRIDKLAKKYKNKKVLAYGAGLFFDVLLDKFDISKLNIVAISDKKFQDTTEYKGVRAIPPCEIKNLSFDVLIIATLEPERLEDSLKKDFYPECGKFKIDFFNTYTFKEFWAEVKECLS